MRDWPLSAWIKFPVVCFVTGGILLLSYQLFVRYTPIGTLLNGPRRSTEYAASVAQEIPIIADLVADAPVPVEAEESIVS